MRKGESVVHPALEPYLRAVRESPSPHPSTTDIAERRRSYRELADALRGHVDEMKETRDIDIALDGRTLHARLYVPLGDKDSALVIYFHGGSFVVGDLETHDWLCRRLAHDTEMRILAVEYRLAPEYPFPAAVNDATDTLRYVATHVSDFASPTAQLLAMGDSAGGTLVAVASAVTRNEGLSIAAQILIYPTMGPELVTDSAHRFGVGYMLDLDHLRFDYTQYLDGFANHSDPRVTPLMFSDLSGAPPAIVLVAECDPLRDEGIAYAGLLEHFGVRVEVLEAEGMVHGFLRMGGIVPEALDIVDDLAKHMHHFVEHASA